MLCHVSQSSLDEETSSVAVTLTGPSSAETETEEYLATLDAEVMNRLERRSESSPPAPAPPPPDVETLSLQEKTEATFVLVPLRRNNSKDTKESPLIFRERESSKTVVEKSSSLLPEARSARPNTVHVSLGGKKHDDSVPLDAPSPRKREDAERPAVGVYSSPLANRKSTTYLGTLSEKSPKTEETISASFANSTSEDYVGSPIRTRLLQAGSASLKPHRMAESIQDIPKSPSVQNTARREDDLGRQLSSRGGIATTARSQRSDSSPVPNRRKNPSVSPGITMGRKKPIGSSDKKFDFDDWK